MEGSYLFIMDYIQEMISLSNDSILDLEKTERAILVSFTDDMVKFGSKSDQNYYQNEDLKKALHKIIDNNMFIRYYEILMRRNEYSMKDFSERMDKK